MEPGARPRTPQRTNRLLLALAAAWMAISLAIGGAAVGDPADNIATTQGITRASQP